MNWRAALQIGLGLGSEEATVKLFAFGHESGSNKSIPENKGRLFGQEAWMQLSETGCDGGEGVRMVRRVQRKREGVGVNMPVASTVISQTALLP